VAFILSGRLELRPLLPEHAEEMAVVLDDPDLHAYIGGSPATPGELLVRYERLAAGSPDPEVTWLNWVIWYAEEGRLVGYLQATIKERVAEIAWVVGTPWQGRGLAKEGARALVGWLWTQPVDAIVAHINPGHHASAAVASAAGFAPTDHWQDGEIRWYVPRQP
jgi:RimJ/RimL family protein N-acetyltransferase